MTEVESFNVEFKRKAAAGYWFKVKNPRDEQEFRDAARVFADKIINVAHKSFEWGNIEAVFLRNDMLEKVHVFMGSYSIGEDVKFLKLRVHTTNYLDYCVEYEVYVGYPYEAFKENVNQYDFR